MTKVAVDDLLQLINCHFPNTVAASKFIFFKQFCNVENDIEKHLYCSKCSNYLGFIQDSAAACSICENLNVLSENVRNDFFFFYMPVKKQVHQLLSEKSIAESLYSNTHVGIFTGALYKQKVHQNELSLLWNCDGVPVFKSSSFSIWPLQCVINELPYKLQREHVMLVGLWFGQSKPRIDTFLKRLFMKLIVFGMQVKQSHLK